MAHSEGKRGLAPGPRAPDSLRTGLRRPGACPLFPCASREKTALRLVGSTSACRFSRSWQAGAYPTKKDLVGVPATLTSSLQEARELTLPARLVVISATELKSQWSLKLWLALISRE